MKKIDADDIGVIIFMLATLMIIIIILVVFWVKVSPISSIFIGIIFVYLIRNGLTTHQNNVLTYKDADAQFKSQVLGTENDRLNKAYSILMAA